MGDASPLIRKVSVLGIAAVVVVCVSLYLLNVVIPKGIVQYVESALKIEISGRIQPVWGKAEFKIDPLAAFWDEKVKINSGRVIVGYGLDNFSRGRLRVVLTGKDFDAQLMGDWISLSGATSVVFTNVYADLIIGHDGIKEIRALRAESPTLQFRFGETSNRQLKEAHEA